MLVILGGSSQIRGVLFKPVVPHLPGSGRLSGITVVNVYSSAMAIFSRDSCYTSVRPSLPTFNRQGVSFLLNAFYLCLCISFFSLYLFDFKNVPPVHFFISLKALSTGFFLVWSLFLKLFFPLFEIFPEFCHSISSRLGFSHF